MTDKRLKGCQPLNMSHKQKKVYKKVGNSCEPNAYLQNDEPAKRSRNG